MHPRHVRTLSPIKFKPIEWMPSRLGTVNADCEQGDQGIIYPNGYMQTIESGVNTTSDGQLTSGCFLRSITDDLSTVNSSWATETTLPGFDYPITSTANLIPFLNLTTNSTNCGISPILNVTLLNQTAHDNYVPYQNFSYAMIWSWVYLPPTST